MVGSATSDDPRLVVEAWLGVATEDGPRALMLRRSEAHGPFWQGISGRVEPTDATLREAVHREMREETGIEGGYTLHDIGPWIDFESAYSDRFYRKRPIAVVLPADTTAASVRLSHEHVEVRLATFDEARALVQWPGNAEALTALERLL